MVARIEKDGGAAAFVKADLSAGADVIGRLATDAVAAADGRIDVLVNNAALLLAPTPTAEVAQETIDEALAVSVRSMFLLTGLLVPPMAERGHGAVVNLGSISGMRGMAHSVLYSMTKAAVHSLTASWAAEYGPHGVRVNTVAPGPTLTEKVAAMEEHLAPVIAGDALAPRRRPRRRWPPPSCSSRATRRPKFTAPPSPSMADSPRCNGAAVRRAGPRRRREGHAR